MSYCITNKTCRKLYIAILQMQIDAETWQNIDIIYNIIKRVNDLK
jgi:hypothetical protein